MSDEGKEESRTGFAGLSSMVSDIDATVARAENTRPDPSAGAVPGARARPASQPPPAEETKQSSEPPNSINWVLYQKPGHQKPGHQQSGHQQPGHQQPGHQPSGGRSGGKWLLGIGVAVGAIWLFSLGSGPNTASTSTTAGTTSTATTSTSSEESPPAGTNNVLSYAQIRY